MQRVDNFKMIGQRIRETRKAQKLTQAELASVCGVGVRFIREVEQGKETCQTGKVLVILQLLGLEIILASRGEL